MIVEEDEEDDESSDKKPVKASSLMKSEFKISFIGASNFADMEKFKSKTYNSPTEMIQL